MRLIIPGRLPSLNEYIAAERSNRFKAASMKKKAEELITKCIKEQRLAAAKEPVMLHFKWFEQNKRRDLDNIAFAKKFIQDALVRSGILTNDGQQNIKGFTDEVYVDKEWPRITVEIEQAE